MNATAGKPFLVLGGGGHARVLLDMLRLLDAEVLGVVTAGDKVDDALPMGVRVLGDDAAVAAYAPHSVLLVNGVGFTKASVRRRQLLERFAARGYVFPALVHPAACISPGALLHDGCQIMAGAVVQTGAVIGAGAIVNTRAAVDHDCQIGCCAHIGPGATLSGGVVVGDCSLVGVGAAVIQGVRIGTLSTVGAGSAVVQDVADYACVAGTPAHRID